MKEGPFSPLEAVLLLVSNKNRDLWEEKIQFSEFARSSRLVFSPNQIVKLDSEHVQSDGKSVNRGLRVFDLSRGRLSGAD